jgi:hypothetical protein
LRSEACACPRLTRACALLSPWQIHGGILSIRNSPDHEAQISELGIEKIDLVVVNLYPFEATVASGADYATCVENIDIGGPAMLRAAAKNHAGVLIVTDPSDYGALIDEMQSNGGSSTSFATRKKLAAKAYARSAEYDAQISAWYATQLDDEAPELPAVTRVYEPEFALKYGNNPHQVRRPGCRRGTVHAAGWLARGATNPQGAVCADGRGGVQHRRAAAAFHGAERHTWLHQPLCASLLRARALLFLLAIKAEF